MTPRPPLQVYFAKFLLTAHYHGPHLLWRPLCSIIRSKPPSRLLDLPLNLRPNTVARLVMSGISRKYWTRLITLYEWLNIMISPPPILICQKSSYVKLDWKERRQPCAIHPSWDFPPSEESCNPRLGNPQQAEEDLQIRRRQTRSHHRLTQAKREFFYSPWDSLGERFVK